MTSALGALFEMRRQMRDLFAGRTESIGDVTITKSDTTTTVPLKGCGTTDAIALHPLDATTALEFGLGTTWAEAGVDEFVVHHPSNTDDRVYRWVRHFGIRS